VIQKRRFARSCLRPALLAACIAACSARGGKPQAPRPVSSTEAEAPPPLSPARWAFTDKIGAIFDEATPESPLPRVEPAIVDGARVLLEAGIVVGSARHADRFAGFRSLPERLGGGYLLWSQDRLYLAKEFLGTARAIADVGATGGARSWFSSILLRTPEGIFTIDPRAPSFSLRRVAVPGIADGIASGDRRGVRLDLLSRASYTVDGGATWTAVLASKPLLVHALREGPSGEIILEADDAQFVLGQSGSFVREDRTKKPKEASDDAAPDVRPRTSRELPGDALAEAVAGGALLPGGRMLVAHGGGALMLATRTALTIVGTDLPSLDPRLSHCQAVFAGSPAAALACVAETGAFFLALDSSLARPALEATFPEGGGGFFGGPRARLAYDGRCGPARPATNDVAAEAPAPSEPPDGSDELPHDDDARVCVRAAPSHWIERRIGGDDARHLYRWVPGDDGDVTALVLASAPSSSRSGVLGTTREGVRVVRVDPSDPALGGGAFPAVPPPASDGAHRSVDVDFWQDERGDVRGWVVLPSEGEKLDLAKGAQGPAHRLLPVITRSGGRAAGVRISAAGQVTLFPLPKDVVEVLMGGLFGLAMATREQESRWYETTDGGASWTEVAGPPTGALEAATDEGTPHACSPIGCAWGAGIVRLGWGGPPPVSAPESSDVPGAPHRRALNLACRFDGPPPWPGPSARGTETPLVGLLVPGPKLAELPEPSWAGEVLPPFDPASLPRKLPVHQVLRAGAAEIMPVLGLGAHAEVDALVVIDEHRLRASARGPAAPARFDAPTRFAVAADLPGGSLAFLDAERGAVWLARGDATTTAVNLERAPDVSRMRFTLAQRIAPGSGLALAASSTTAGDLVAGDLDLARADVGPLASLGRLDQLTEGACPRASHRLVIDLPLMLRMTWTGNEKPFETSTTVAALVDAGGGAVCVEAVTASIRRDGGGPAVLRARLGARGAASVWAEGRVMRGVCSLDQSDRKR
jgi:hypothetical protein